MNKIDSIIRSHFHGFSDSQFNELKKEFPFSEIPFIIREVIIKVLSNQISTDEINNYIRPAMPKDVKGNLYSQWSPRD